MTTSEKMDETKLLNDDDRHQDQQQQASSSSPTQQQQKRNRRSSSRSKILKKRALSFRRKVQERQEELERQRKRREMEKSQESFFQKYILSSISSFVKYLRAANYIVVLLSFTSICCLVFAVILMIIAPQVRDLQRFSDASVNARSASISSNCDPSGIGFSTTTTSSTTTMTSTTTFASSSSATNINNNTITNETVDPSSQQQLPRMSLNFLDAVFLSTSAFTASGLNSVYYFDFGTGCYFLFGLEMTIGSIVLLTMLPAILRYRPLAEERRKLILILEATGAYDHFLEHIVDEKFGAPTPLVLSPVNNNNNNNNNNEQEVNPLPNCRADVDSPINESIKSSNDNNHNHNQGLSSPILQSSSFARVSATTPSSKRVLTERERTTNILGYNQSTTSKSSLNIMMSSPPHAASPLSPADEGIITNNNNESFFLSSPQLKEQEEKKSSTLTFGQRIVYEDGLAHVNQQIDICLIIIFGCLFYWFSIHLLFLVLVLASGKDFGWSIFTVISSFNNAGFAIDDDSMISIDENNYLMIILTILMALGNSLFPLMFRLMLTGIHKLLEMLTKGQSEENSNNTNNKEQQQQQQQQQKSFEDEAAWSYNKEEQQQQKDSSSSNTIYQKMSADNPAASSSLSTSPEKSPEQKNNNKTYFLGQPLLVWRHSLWLFLRYPRRYYTHLFSLKTSLVLFAIWFVMTSLGLILLIPELDQKGLLKYKSEQAHGFFIGLFQAVSVRTTGFSIVDTSRVTSGHLCWWVFAFLFAAYPFILTVRSSGAREKDHAKKRKNDKKLAMKRKLMMMRGGSANNDEIYQEYLKSLASEDGGNNNNNNTSHSLQDESGDGNVNVSLTLNSSDDDEGEEHDADDFDSVIDYEDLISDLDESEFLDDDDHGDNNNNYNYEQLGGDNNKNGGNSSDDEDHDERYLRQTTAKKEIQSKQSVKRLATDQLARDLFWLYLAITVIMYCEHVSVPDESLDHDYALYLRVVFEVASAFGNVGISMGRTAGLSFSGSFSSGVSKFVVVLVMYFGKHRFLPKSVDEAIAIKKRSFDFTGELNPEKKSKSYGNLHHAAAAEEKNKENNSTDDHATKTSSISRARFLFYRRRVEAFYAHYNPARIPQIDKIMAAFEQNPKALLNNLQCTYGPEPSR